jgi:DNA-binding CsgD family transcriptional regulator
MFTVSVATVFGAFILDADKLFFTLLYVLTIVGCLVIVFYSSALRFNLGSAAAEVTPPLPAPDYCARYGLTQRETEVLDCILSGQSIAEISEALFISQRTVKYHITSLLRKTGATSQKELLVLLYKKQGK